ncbi:PAS-domain containing protein [Thalassobaculum sp.]|uniref:PAS-domain containing protein n=1 Tax=Thalassobaculum sp. TaxID=2022740 RepID=UPI0032EC96B3
MISLRELAWLMLRYGVLVVGFCAFLVGVFFIFQGLIQQRELIEKESRINIWFLAQTEIEFLRFQDSLKDYELAPNPETAEVARQRFEIFWSRLPPLLEGTQTAELRAIEGVVPTAKEIIQVLKTVESEMEDLQSVPLDALTKVKRQLNTLGGPVHDLVRRALLYESNEVSRGRSRHNELYQQLLGLFGLTLVMGLVIFFMLFRQIVKTHRAIGDKERAATQAITARNELELAINSISEGFIIYDQDDRVALFNKRYVDLHPQQADLLCVGISFEELLRAAVRNGGVTVREGGVDEWVASILEQRRATAETTFESRLSDGHWLRISERRTSDGRLVGVHTDITELKKRESLVAQKSELLQTTLDNMKQGIAVFDAAANLVLFNNQYLMVNHYPQELVDNSIAYREFATFAARRGDFGPGEPEAIVNSQVAAIEELLRTRSGNLRQQRRLQDGRVVETVVTALPTGGFVKTYEDVTERITSEAERVRLTEMYHAAQKTQALGTLAGGIAHDFNNIIGGIIGNCSLMIEDVPKHDPAHGRLQQILDSGTRARDLVRQILTYSRNAESERKPLDLGATVTDSLSTLRSLMPGNVTLRAHNVENCFIEGDATQIHQVMLNVCVNAAQSIGDRRGRVTVSVQSIDVVGAKPSEGRRDRSWEGRSVHGRAGTLVDGQYVRLTVTDTGCGIPEEVMPRIFEPFYTTKEVGQGTGLGLAAVHGIVRNHDGVVVIESLAEVGTRFDFYFPQILVPLTASAGEAPKEPAEEGSERVLLVDDDRVLLSVTREILERLGYMVEAHVEPEQALESFNSDPNAWDLVITDRSMPKMTGEELVIAMKKIRDDVPVLMLSGFVSIEDIERLTAAGIDSVIGKPVLPDELAASVRTVLGRASSDTRTTAEPVPDLTA